MRRVLLLLAMVALLVGVFASAALALSFDCSDSPCYGTRDGNIIDEQTGEGLADHIFSLKGADYIDASDNSGDVDEVFGNQGAD
jgi:hypothetical protein